MKTKDGKAGSDPGCPCGTGHAYAVCCGPYHGGLPTPDAERLMRSRYCAFVRELREYLLQTWHASTRPPELDLDAEPKPQWLGLTVERHEPIDAEHARVTFVARFKVAGKAHRLREVSRFVREDGRWYYVDGEFPLGPSAP
jgi:SEC-C motif-containing protein